MTQRNLCSRALPTLVALLLSAVATPACVNVDVPEILLGDDAGASDADAAVDAPFAPFVDLPQWTPGTQPSPGAILVSDACTALTDCCSANAAGDLYCDPSSTCDADFQRELDFGYCAYFTYVGYVVDVSVSPEW